MSEAIEDPVLRTLADVGRVLDSGWWRFVKDVHEQDSVTRLGSCGQGEERGRPLPARAEHSHMAYNYGTIAVSESETPGERSDDSVSEDRAHGSCETGGSRGPRADDG